MKGFMIAIKLYSFFYNLLTIPTVLVITNYSVIVNIWAVTLRIELIIDEKLVKKK